MGELLIESTRFVVRGLVEIQSRIPIHTKEDVLLVLLCC